MGISTQACRIRIGTFIQPIKTKTTIKTFQLKYVSLCLRIALFHLLLAEGIESNPGPTNARGRGAHRRGTNTQSAEPPSVSSAGLNDEMNSNQHYPIRENRTTRRSEMAHSQTSVSSWLRTGNFRDKDTLERLTLDTDTSDADVEVESTTDILLEIRRDVKRMDKKFDSLEKCVTELQKENDILKQSNAKLTSEVTELNKRTSTLQETITSTELKYERLELQLKKNNLKIFGVPEVENETQSILEENIRELIKDSLGVDDSDIKFDDLYRKSGSRMVFARFAHYADRKAILTAFRSKRKSTDLPFRISEDLPHRISLARSELYPFFKECLDSGKSAYFKYDKLIVDNEIYTYCKDKKCPVSVKK
jgi:hypothetical protein